MKIIKNQILTLGLIVAMLGIPAMANATKGIPIGDGWAPSLFFGILLVIALWPFWLILSVALLVAYLLYKTYYTQLRLDPLPPETAEELLQELLGTDTSLARIFHKKAQTSCKSLIA